MLHLVVFVLSFLVQSACEVKNFPCSIEIVFRFAFICLFAILILILLFFICCCCLCLAEQVNCRVVSLRSQRVIILGISGE